MRLIGKFSWCAALFLGVALADSVHAVMAASAIPLQSSASANVQVKPSLILNMPGLQRQRQLRIYLPPSYATSKRRYPVLYMHDAQNLFDRATAYAGEWEVDESLDALAKSGQLELIVVGIDNGGERRMTELNPWNNADFGKAEGDAYLDFIVNVVKPAIDAQYRTQPGRTHTAIMGSSMGGLISHYAISRHPTVFSKAGIFSPSYPLANESYAYFASHPPARDARLYLLAGEREGGHEMADAATRMRTALLLAGHPSQQLTLTLDPQGEHNEALWRTWFPKAVLWLFKPNPEGN